MLLSGSPTIAEIICNVGYNHVVVDMEHSPLDVSSTVSMLRAIDASRGGTSTNRVSTSTSTSTTPIVRVPSHLDIANTKRILDILQPPAGIMFPMIETASDARLAISSVLYPPKGIRGCAHSFVRASGYGTNTNYFHDDSNNDYLKIVQVESARAIENIPEIGLVDGVDCIFLGPLDISCSIGKMGQFEENGQVMELIRHAEQLVRETSIRKRDLYLNKNDHDEQQGEGEGDDKTGGRLILGGFRSPGRMLEEMFSEDVGYQFVAGSVDLGLIQSAAKMDLMDAKRATKKKNRSTK